jgi:DNA-binding beta-propeller fold protein YncE
MPASRRFRITVTGVTRAAARLPAATHDAAGAVLGGQAYLFGGGTSASVPTVQGARRRNRIGHRTGLRCRDRGPAPCGLGTGQIWVFGGEDGPRAVPTVTTLRLVPSGQVLPQAGRAPWLAPATGPGLLAAGSDPSVLPADVLIADHMNNRLLIVDPQGRIRWEFPRPGDLAPGQTFLSPDDAFFSPDGRYIIATQEDDYAISVISVATSKIVYRYGVPGVPGAGPNHLFNPDDAMLTPTGNIVSADIKNCRVVVITPPAHVLTRVIGQTTNACLHDPPYRFGSPNGAFPVTDGNYLITEINGDWADEMSLSGAVSWSANPPGVLYPSDTNEVYPGRYLTADYSDPGQIVEFTSTGHLLWRMGGFNQPSLALPLLNGDILLNDDFNHRVCVVDPATNRIVWQYGHTGKSGSAPGYLNDPDGVDLVPPDSLLVTHAATMGEP